MKTSSWFAYQGPGRVGISRGTPRGQPAGYRVFKTLAPGAWFNSVSPGRYRDLFFSEILGPLDPQRIHDQLHELTAGAEPVLLCFEAPDGSGGWCHRAMVSEWFGDRLGIEVPELGREDHGFGRTHPLLPEILNPQAPPPDLLDDVSAYTGKVTRFNDRGWKVIGPSEEKPGQAIIERDDGQRCTASLEVLRRHFG